MKRLVPLVCASLLSVNIANAQANQNEIIQSKSYIDAYTLFQLNKYDESFRAFDRLVEKHPDNATVNFYYARSAFELKNYELAYTIYDRLLIDEPTNAMIRVEYARTLFMMKSFNESKKEFEKVLASPIPVNVRQNIEKFIKAIDENQKDYIFNRVAIFGFGFDDNIGTNSGDSTWAGVPLSNNDEKSGIHFKTIVLGSLMMPFKTNEKFVWESTGIGYIKEEYQEHGSDVWLASLSSGISYNTKNYKNLTSVIYDRVSVESDSYAFYYGIKNSQKFKLGKNTLGLDLSFKKKKMFNNTTDNSNIKEAVVSYSIPFDTQKLNLDLMTSFAKEDPKNSAASPSVKKNTRKHKVSLKKEFSQDLSGTVGFQKEYGYYKKPFFGTFKRDDKIDTISLKIDKKLDKTKALSFEINKIKSNSTIGNLYSYDKKTFNVNYMVIF